MGETTTKLENPQIFIRGRKPKKVIRTAGGNDVHANVGGVAGKCKRKTSIIKLAETTQFITRFSRTHASSGGSATGDLQQHQMTQMQRLIVKTQSGSGSERTQNTPVSGIQNAGGRITSKFKTSGIVVRAVQQSVGNHAGVVNVSRRIRHAGGLPTKNDSNSVASDTQNIFQCRTEDKSVAGISLGTVNLVRKVKTKLKKRKSRTLANDATTSAK